MALALALAVAVVMARPVVLRGQSAVSPTPPAAIGCGVRAAATAGPPVETKPATPPARCHGGGTLTYPPGWNLLAGNNGSVVLSTGLPLYTLATDGTAYAAVPMESAEGYTWTPLEPGVGYWAYFSQSTTLYFPPPPPRQPVNVPATAGQYVMIGNPFPGPAIVSCADLVYFYDPATGYQTTMTLQPGQGAFAYSSDGATITISPAFP